MRSLHGLNGELVDLGLDPGGMFEAGEVSLAAKAAAQKVSSRQPYRCV